MKTVSCFPSHARIAALAFLAAWFAAPGDGYAQSPDAQLPNGLACKKVPPEGHVTSNPITCPSAAPKVARWPRRWRWPRARQQG
jgi:hypothetical protein